MEMEKEKKERTTWLQDIEKIQEALKPLNYEVRGFDVPYNEPLVIKLMPVFPTLD